MSQAEQEVTDDAARCAQLPARPAKRVSSMFPVADVLLAAAHSDRPASTQEHAAIRALLCKRLGVAELPERLEQRIQAFDPSQRRDFATLVDEVVREDVVSRRSMVELTRAVCDADGDIDLSEDEFMLALAVSLGLPVEASILCGEDGLDRSLAPLTDVLVLLARPEIGPDRVLAQRADMEDRLHQLLQSKREVR